MNLIAPTLDAAFIEKQRRHLVELRAALLESMPNDEAEEAGHQARTPGSAAGI
jgi:hypothetical protein